MTRRHAGAVLVSLAVTAGLSFSLFASAPVASAQVAPASPASVSTTSATAAVTPACKKAKKVVKKAWKARVAAKASGNLDRFVAADQKWRKAKIRKAKACKVVTTPVDSTTPKPTFSGDPLDPRPAGWVRPVDGSGKEGSNGVFVEVIGSCPVTVSSGRIERRTYDNGENYTWFDFDLQNYSDADRQFVLTLSAVDGNGKYLNQNLYTGNPGTYIIKVFKQPILAWEETGVGVAMLSIANGNPAVEGIRMSVSLSC